MASEELKKIYSQAFERGLFVKEFEPSDDGYIAYASSYRKLEGAGYNKEKREKMGMMDANLYMAPGLGRSREEAVEKAIDQFLETENWMP